MGLAGRLGEEWRAEQYELPSLPSCIYLSLHPEEAGGEIRLHTEQWQKKNEGIQGKEVVGGGGVGGSCVGLGLGLGSRSAGISAHRSEPQLQACRREGRSLCTPWQVSVVGEKQPGSVLYKGEFGK